MDSAPPRSFRGQLEKIGLRTVAVLIHETRQADADQSVATIGGALDTREQGACLLGQLASR